MAHLLDIICEAQVTVIKLNVRELNHANIHRISVQLLGLADCVAGSRLCLDLGRVRRVTSSALELIVRLHKRMRAAGGVLVLEKLSPFVYDDFCRVCLDRLPALWPTPANDLTLPLAYQVA
jgi:anti-anti-sigma factor